MELNEISDRLILDALRDGRKEAFEMMFRDWYTPLCRFARTLLQDSDESEEAVQQVFVTMWEKRQEIAVEISVKAYVYRAVRNTCLNVLKHRKVVRHHERYAVAGGMMSVHPVFESQPGGELERALANAMNALPEQCRKVFEMSRFGGKKYQEIATELGISVKTVENHMGKALRILREKLADFLPLLLLLIKGIQ